MGTSPVPEELTSERARENIQRQLLGTASVILYVVTNHLKTKRATDGEKVLISRPRVSSRSGTFISS